MSNFENPVPLNKDMEPNLSIHKIFEHRKDYIPEVGRQLQKPNGAQVEINGEKLNVDYRIISIESLENKNVDPVILLPGFGSGWEGISELGFSLACEGRRVIMPSLPGYGNSNNPSEGYYKTLDFDNEAEVMKKLIEQIEEKKEVSQKKFHLIGHSMASEIRASFAEKYPDYVSSLVLLNPAGVKKKENSAFLGTKFILSGIHTSAEFAVRTKFSGEKDYENDLRQYIPKPKGPFGKGRLAQRLSEAKRLSKGHLLDKVRNIENPIIYISGELDSVYPPGEQDQADSQLAKLVEAAQGSGSIDTSVVSGLRHNTTIAPDEITAANIEHYLEKAEKANSDKII